ncbi:serine/threonine-protein kinase, partial [Rubripirellula sp.]
GGSEGSSLSDLGEIADLPDHDMEIVDLSSRYKIEKSLGKGGMGEVLLATDTRLDRKVAIKRIRGDAGSRKAAVARFLTEAKSIAALSHNNVVQIHDYGRDEQGPFLIMEYVSGGSLLDRCKQGPIELEEAVELACQLCDGLGRAHDAGIIHRDIKPANILLTDDSLPKLTDFGLAKAQSRDHTMTMAGAVLGTLDFMPPEQRQDASLVDARSDLWSLAATLYQMVTGESPKVIRLNKVPVTLQNLLDKALEENKEDRFQAASELKEALQQSLHGGNVASVELERGVCPTCGTRNEASRKFCRNTSCAASLQVKCLSCSATIPVWEGVCGECGSIQTDLLEQRREEMTSQKLEAETFLVEHDYKRATELAIEIGNEADPRLQQLKTWSDEFPKAVESTKRVQVESAKQAIAEALSHEKAYDYRSGIKAFSQIPDSILASQDLTELEPARDVLARLQEKQGHANTLEAEIKSRIKAKSLSGLLFEVESLLGLLPERADLLKLQQQLQKRESDLEKVKVKTLAASKASMQQHDYAGVLSVIAKLNPEQVDNEFAELHSLAKAREARCQKLSRQIRQAVNAEQYEGLLALIEEYLTLKPNDIDALKFRDELSAREQKEQAETAALLAQQREESKKKQAAAKQLAAKQRARKLQLIVGLSIAAAFVLMLTVMFYLRAQGIARDISVALSRGDYAATLELDPGHRQARMMKQNAEDLATALRSRDYRRALQLDPSNAEALSMKKAADIQQALSDGDYAAALQLDPSN